MIVSISIAANRRTFPRWPQLPSQICHVFPLSLPNPQMGKGWGEVRHELQIANFVFIFIVLLLLLPKNSVTCRAVCAGCAQNFHFNRHLAQLERGSVSASE